MATTGGESQLLRIIRDLQDAVTELSKEFKEAGEPITDDSINLQKFSYKLEYLLQFDQKEKTTLLGNRKDYWDYFCDCLAKVKGANDGIRFVKSISELRTPLGKGRAFIRYSLVHQRLADTLQQCFMNTKITSDWYYIRSPFLNPKMSSDIFGQLYEFTEVQFDLASRGYDLDAAWPTFARRTLPSLGSSAYLWKPPSRTSSMSSLVSGYLQAQEFPSSPDANHTEQLEGFDEMHAELDQAEIRERELQDRIRHLEKENRELQAIISLQKDQVQAEKEKSSNFSEENSRLAKMMAELEKQCEVSFSTQNTVHNLQKCLHALELNAVEKQKDYHARLEQLESSKEDGASKLQLLKKELETTRASVSMKDLCIGELRAKLSLVEQKNLDLLTKADAILDERGQQSTTQYESMLKIQELLEKLQQAEKENTKVQKLNSEHLSQLKTVRDKLHLKEEAQKELQSRLDHLTSNSREESEKLVLSLEMMAKEMDAAHKELVAKDQEVADLQIQLKEMLARAESLEKNLDGAKKEKEKLQEESSCKKEAMEQEAKTLAEQLELLEDRLSKLSQNVHSLEEQNRQLISDRDHLSNKIDGLEEHAEQQSSALCELREENVKLKSQNAKLQQSKKKVEEKQRNLDASKASLEAEIARLRASEKQLQSQIDDALVSVDEKERKLRGQNKRLDEDLQNATRQNQILEEQLNVLQSDYQELRQREDTIKESFAVLQAEHKSSKQHGLQMEKSLASMKESEKSLQSQLTEKKEALQVMETKHKQLQREAERFRKNAEALEMEKLSMEKTCLHQTKLIESLTTEKASVENAQLEQASCQEKESKELASRLVMSEKQLQIHQAEVSRLLAELIDLRAKFQQTAEERQRLQDKVDVTEAVLSEQKILVQQLKEQTELLNRDHVQELLQCKDREEVLKKERDREAHRKAELEKNLLCLREELSEVKQYLESVKMENAETKDLLHRTNTDMAELGIQICSLTSEKGEAEEKLAQVTEKLGEFDALAAKERERLQLDLSALSHDNQSLLEKLQASQASAAAVPSLQTQLEMVGKQAQVCQETSKEELSAVKFQLSTEIINYQTKFKAVSEECEKAKEQLDERSRRLCSAEEELTELQVTQKELNKANEQIKDYSDKFHKMIAERDSNDQKLLAELDDLTRTKQFLEERLIELLRDKDALWQKSDALEFQQKLSAEQRWLGDTEVNHCLDCQREFTWMMRRHHCRMCGRIFCYYCCNNYMMSKHSGKKERCCRACIKKPSIAVDDIEDSGSHASQEDSPTQLDSPVSPGRGVTVTNEASKLSDDAVFDIITEDEVSQAQESDSVNSESQTEVESLDQSVTDLNSTGNSSTFDESEELQVTQDTEICLLKSGELMIKLPLTVEEILNFGESKRELFIKSSTYSIIPITVAETGLTINWVFSSDPKSISFSVVYQESEEATLDQCKVLIPMTRCNSHKETIRGQVKVRNSGIYILIFDNTFSRFISKKVFYHLTVEQPVIYDGSDFP
uniref:FYVE and coiled-coil domain-containing protein 1 n=1 Tax=Sphenodon punctatus TaxID=8508 RepID=A0A8D0L9W5_SPHPU